jgi:hypothetical protein
MTAHARADEPAAYPFKLVVTPSYRTDDYEPLLRLLSQRFTAELWTYGSYRADITYGRMQRRVVKDRSRMRFLNEWRFARAVLRRARELRSASGSSIAAKV